MADLIFSKKQRQCELVYRISEIQDINRVKIPTIKKEKKEVVMPFRRP